MMRSGLAQTTGRIKPSVKALLTGKNYEQCLDTLAPLIDGPLPHLSPLYTRLEDLLEQMDADQSALDRVRQRAQTRAKTKM